MRLPRFSILQLLLAATLVALLLGLFTAAWRAGKVQEIEHVCFSPSGKYLAAGYSGGTVRVWRLDQDRPRLAVQAFGDEPYLQKDLQSLHFLDDHRLLKLESVVPPYAAVRVNVRAVDVETGKVSEIMPIDMPYVQQQSVAATGNRLFVADWPGGGTTILCFDLDKRLLERKIVIGAKQVFTLTLSADGNTLAAKDMDRTVHLIDVATGQELQAYAGGPYGVVSLNADGSRLATIDRISSHRNVPSKAVVVDTHSAGPPEELPVADGKSTSWVALSRDGSKLAVAGLSGVESYDVANKELLRSIPFNKLTTVAVWQLPFADPLRRLALAPDGRTLAMSSGTQVRFWDLETGEMRDSISGPSRLVPVFMFTFGFAVWAAAWGIVRKRQRAFAPVCVVAQMNPPAPRELWCDSPWPIAPFIVATGWLCMAVVLALLAGAIDGLQYRQLQVWALALVGLVVCLQVVRLIKVARLARAAITSRDANLVADMQSTERPVPPIDLRFCWRLMVAGGLVALAIPIGFLFFDGPTSLFTGYFSLFVGMAAISRGAAGDTLSLSRTTQLQALNIIAFDPVNLLFAAMELFLLRRPHVKQYLLWANGGRPS